MAEVKGTITAGGTAQQLYAQNTASKMVAIQNNSAGPLTVSFEGQAPTATGPLVIPAGAYFYTPMEQPLGMAAKIWGATTGQAFTVWTY
jgi:hypothetical protein